jgi:hypothetical protein
MDTNLQTRRSDVGRRYGAWLGGLGLILLGLVFLLQNFGYFAIGNWWALFILFPAAGAYLNAFTAYHDAGHFTPVVRASLIGGLLLTLVASIFLFNLNWGMLWPMFIILAGISALLTAWLGTSSGNLPNQINASGKE